MERAEHNASELLKKKEQKANQNMKKESWNIS